MAPLSAAKTVRLQAGSGRLTAAAPRQPPSQRALLQITEPPGYRRIANLARAQAPCSSSARRRGAGARSLRPERRRSEPQEWGFSGRADSVWGAATTRRGESADGSRPRATERSPRQRPVRSCRLRALRTDPSRRSVRRARVDMLPTAFPPDHGRGSRPCLGRAEARRTSNLRQRARPRFDSVR
jgi:hypothetical protein